MTTMPVNDQQPKLAMRTACVKGCSRIDSIELRQHAVYNNLWGKEGEVGHFRAKTYCQKERKATVTWPYTGIGPLQLVVIELK